MEDAIAGFFVFLIFAFLIAWYVMVALAVQKIAKATEHEDDAWFAWFPIVHEVLLLRLVGKPEWWIVIIYFVPFANWVMRWVLQYHLLQYCRKPGWWLVVWILFPPAYPFMVWRMANDFVKDVVPSQDFDSGRVENTQEGYF